MTKGMKKSEVDGVAIQHAIKFNVYLFYKFQPYGLILLNPCAGTHCFLIANFTGESTARQLVPRTELGLAVEVLLEDHLERRPSPHFLRGLLDEQSDLAPATAVVRPAKAWQQYSKCKPTL